ncbi:UDP-3-O-acyl-N-acetylglucosamine deacetylase [Methylocystis sp. JAN1]|uniref:UDP-3-O-acyl-N-acetylglucosamine deacetylase n=1 Tax=Methylocystis sp. JAN1 TaxID=3397211 RepID=UPI003FA27A95
MRLGAAAQTTLARPATLSGFGVHDGKPARLTLAPAAAGAGVVFNVAGADIVADWRVVDATQLRTRLSAEGASVSTVEHLLAALAGLGVDNALVEVEGDEIPAMDGSAEAFVSAIDEAGVAPLPAPRAYLRVVSPVRVSDGACWAELTPATAGLRLDVEIAFGGRIGRQRRALDLTPESFRLELARARTFGFLRDAERLWRAGLALGASLENTVVLDGESVLNPQGLRYADEFVRHKMLDVVGDLALAGAPIIGVFRSYRGGHALNLALIQAAMREGAFVLTGARSAAAASSLRTSP